MTKKNRRAKNKKTGKLFASQQQANSLFDQGFAHYQAGRLKEAEDCCRTVLAIDRHHADALHLLGMSRHQQGDNLKAIDFIEKAVSISPDNFFYHLNLGNIYFSRRMYPEAETCYRQALELNPKFIPAFIHLGKNLEQSQRQQEAIRCYRQALTIEPDNTAALTALGNALLAAGMTEESSATLRRLAKVAPDQAESHYNLGGALIRTGELEEATAQFQKALQLNPDFVYAHYGLGTIFGKALKYESAATYCQKALALKPEYAEVHNYLGTILDEQGRTEEAATSFQKALSYKPDLLEAHTSLARYAWINGDWETCRNLLGHLSNKKIIDKDVKFIVPYFIFLDKLLDYRESHASQYVKDENLPPIYVVGDSHCLSTANTTMNFKGVDYLAEAKLILGCKAWHLANHDNNKYKYAFERRIESIPEGSPVILMFGEIDCRINEGLIKHYKKNDVNLTESTINLVDNYLNYILKTVNSKAVLPIICNVPARLLCQDKASDSDKRLQKKVLAKFNQALADNLAKKQIPLLDVYTSSNAQEGRPDSECHIDSNHLLPSVFEHLIKKL